MVDNTVLNAGSGGDSIASDDIGGIKHQRVKVQYGVDGAATDVSDTNPLPIDDAGGSLTVDNGGTFVVQEDGAALTSLQLSDDVVFADDAAFTLASSKVAMAGAIRDDALTTLTAVDGDAVPLRVGSTGALHVTDSNSGTAYTEDVATANPIVGSATLMERDDALSAVTPIEGDWIGLRGSAEGALWTQDFNSDAILADTTAILADTASMDTNLTTVAGAVSGTEMQVDIVSGGGGTEYTEDVATANPIVGSATLMERDDALSAVTPIEGDWIGLRGSAEGALWVQDFNSDAILADTASMDTNLGTIAGAVSGTEVQVDIVSGNVTNAGTFVVQEDGAALTSLQIIDDAVFADDAAFTLASSKVMMAGAIRDDSLTTLTAVDGDSVPLRVGSTGALHVTGGGGGTEYTEDVATANPIVGTATLVERDDVLSAVTPIEGDWIGLRGSAEGALWTQDFNSDAALAALQIIDDSVFADDAAFTLTTSKVNVGGAIRDDTLSALAAVEGDAVPLRVDSTGALHVTSGGGSGSTNAAEYVDDEAFTLTTSTVVAVGAIRDNVLTTLAAAEGDVVPLRVDTEGALQVKDADNQSLLSTIDGNTGVMAGAVHTDDTAFANDGQGNPAMFKFDDVAVNGVDEGDAGVGRMSANRNQYVTIRDAAGNERGLNIDASNQMAVVEASGAAILADTANMDTNLGTIAGAVSGTEVQADIVAALPAGTNAIGKLAANSGVDIGDVDVTSIAAGATLIGDVGLSGARTSGGTTPYKNIDVDETEDEIKGTAGQIYFLHAMNLSAAKLYLKLYNATAASVVVGTTVPDFTFPLATQGDTNGAGFTLDIPNGIAFGTAITIAATTGLADADSGAPGANTVVVNLGYA